jgi:hypothetical protein
MTWLPGPTPIYNNPPIEPQFYQPSQFYISAIALGATTLVTTTVNNNYVLGQQVRLIIPPTFGCRQLNEMTALVIGIPNPNQVILNIFSTGGDAFKSSTATTQPQIIAIGDVNSGQINANGVNSILNIPGSFINISPQ